MKELTTRGPVKDPNGISASWALQSGQPDPWSGRSGLPGRAVRPGIQLSVHQPGEHPAVLDLEDAHEAGDLYVALEAHLENVAARQVPAPGAGNDRLLPQAPEPTGFMVIVPLDLKKAADTLVGVWLGYTDRTAKDPDWIRAELRRTHPQLAKAMDDLVEHKRASNA